MTAHRLEFVTEEIHVAVPTGDLPAVSRNLEMRGFRFQDTSAEPPRAGVILRAEHVVEIETTEIRSGFEMATNLAQTSLDRAQGQSQQLARPGFEHIVPSSYYRPRRRRRQRTWLKVYRVTVEDVIPTGYELAVLDELDADRQLEILANVASLSRDHITIKPKPGWEGYGHPLLFTRQR